MGDNGERIAVAMSGGVDSSVVAALLRQQGLAVHGVFMDLGQPDLGQQIERVRRLARLLKVDLTVMDLRAAFAREVLAYFCRSYLSGCTPNPCVVCNRCIKAGLLLERVQAELGATVLATGHYARISRGEDGLRHLYRGRDQRKDQSYFLCRLAQEQLARLRFPLGEHTKDEVRRLAAQWGLERLHGPESQDICFLKGQSVAEFLATSSPVLPEAGAVVDRSGRQLGTHEGIHRFTVGQRRGLGIPSEVPYYVLGLNAARRQVLIGRQEELLQDALLVRQVHWMTVVPRLPCELEVRIRYRHRAAPAILTTAGEEDSLLVRFHEPQRALTPGQFAVFYRQDEVVGSGEIAAMKKEEFFSY